MKQADARQRWNRIAMGASVAIFIVVGTAGLTVWKRYHREQVRKEMRAAITTGDARRIAELIDEGGDPLIKGENGTTALTAAAMQQDPALAARLARAGVDPNAATTLGRSTALMQAASRGDAATVRVLIAAGADVDARDEIGRTALMDAAMTGSVPVLRVLMQAGADPTLKTGDGRTALSFARQCSAWSPETARFVARVLAEHSSPGPARSTRLRTAAAHPTSEVAIRRDQQ